MKLVHLGARWDRVATITPSTNPDLPELWAGPWTRPSPASGGPPGSPGPKRSRQPLARPRAGHRERRQREARDVHREGGADQSSRRTARGSRLSRWPAATPTTLANHPARHATSTCRQRAGGRRLRPRPRPGQQSLQVKPMAERCRARNSANSFACCWSGASGGTPESFCSEEGTGFEGFSFRGSWECCGGGRFFITHGVKNRPTARQAPRRGTRRIEGQVGSAVAVREP